MKCFRNHYVISVAKEKKYVYARPLLLPLFEAHSPCFFPRTPHIRSPFDRTRTQGHTKDVRTPDPAPHAVWREGWMCISFLWAPCMHSSLLAPRRSSSQTPIHPRPRALTHHALNHQGTTFSSPFPRTVCHSLCCLPSGLSTAVCLGERKDKQR